MRGRREAARHRHAESGEAGNHLADRGVLAADELDVLASSTVSNGMM
jgi:hypothetical protein